MDDQSRNLPKKAIQNWRDQFIGILSGNTASFPKHLWCQVIHQVEQQLLSILQSKKNPKMSAYAHVYGPHTYNATPFVLVGMEKNVYDKPK